MPLFQAHSGCETACSRFRTCNSHETAKGAVPGRRRNEGCLSTSPTKVLKKIIQLTRNAERGIRSLLSILSQLRRKGCARPNKTLLRSFINTLHAQFYMRKLLLKSVCTHIKKRINVPPSPARRRCKPHKQALAVRAASYFQMLAQLLKTTINRKPSSSYTLAYRSRIFIWPR